MTNPDAVIWVEEQGAAVSADVLRLAYMTAAAIVQAPPWPGASFTEELLEPGAGIRIALALERAARAGVRVYIQRAWEAGISWHEVGGALGVAELAPARGSSVAEAAWEYVAGRPAHLSGQPSEFRYVCPDCGEVVSDRCRGRAGPRRRLPPARGRRHRMARPGR